MGEITEFTGNVVGVPVRYYPYKDLGAMTLEAVLELFQGAPLIVPGSHFVFFGGN